MVFASLEELRSALGSAAILFGGVVGFLTLCDMLMPKGQKKRLKGLAETIWIWLSYQQQWPYDRFLRNEMAFVWTMRIAGVLVTAALLFPVWILYYWLRIDKSSGADLVEAVGVLLWIVGFTLPVPALVIHLGRKPLLKLFGWVTSARHVWSSSLRAAAFLMLCLVLLYYTFLSADWVAIRRPEFLYERSLRSVFVFDILISSVALSSFGIVIAVLLLTCVFLMVLAYVALAQLLAVFLKLSEFAALKLAEYEKGPMLALAAVLTATGSILKALGK